MADWLIGNAGARHVVLISRRAKPTEDVRQRLLRWTKEGAEVRLMCCDVADANALHEVLAALRTERPICGMVHFAMVLDDMAMGKLDASVLARTCRPRSPGAKTLID